MAQIREISEALDSSLKSDQLENVTIDFVEALTDSMLQDGFVKEIPIIGTIVGLTKAGINLKDRLFVKKILSFLFGLKDISVEKRKEMIEKLDADGAYKTKVGEKLLYIIDKCEDHEKAALIGRFFSAFLTETISYTDFLKGARIIENAFLDDLKWFLENDWEQFSIEEAGDYINWGLFEILPISLALQEGRDRSWEGKKEYKITGGQLKATITSTGKIVRKILKQYDGPQKKGRYLRVIFSS